jgi:hypothetical protein
MKNEMKLSIIIFAIVMIAVSFGWAFNLSLNRQTYQIGYTVYSENGEIVKGFLPNQRRTASDANCATSCTPETSNFAMQCREQGFQVYAGPCCQMLCSGRVAAQQEPVK